MFKAFQSRFGFAFLNEEELDIIVRVYYTRWSIGNDPFDYMMFVPHKGKKNGKKYVDILDAETLEIIKETENDHIFSDEKWKLTYGSKNFPFVERINKEYPKDSLVYH